VKAADVKAASIDPAAKIIFLGSGCSGSKPGVGMVKFIEINDFSSRKFAVFGTYDCNAGIEVDLIAATLRHRSATVPGSYRYRGKAFLLFNEGHPNQKDPADARKFVKETVKVGIKAKLS
jgi:hypothetical protein